MATKYKLTLNLPQSLKHAEQRVLEGHNKIVVKRDGGYEGKLTPEQLQVAEADPYINVESVDQPDAAKAKAAADAATAKKAADEAAVAQAAKEKVESDVSNATDQESSADSEQGSEASSDTTGDTAADAATENTTENETTE